MTTIPFKQAGEYCNRCYLNFEKDEQEQRIAFKKFAKKALINIINYEKIQDGEIAKEALECCEKCDYESPTIFHFLEKKVVNFY